MSWQAVQWVLRHGPTPEDVDRDGVHYGTRARSLRAVLVVVAEVAQADGTNAHPGLEAVSERSLFSRRQAQRLLDQLEADGWLECSDRGGGRARAAVYSLPRMAVNSDTNSAVNGDTEPETDPERVTSEPVKGDISDRKGDTQMSPQQSFNGKDQRCERAWLEFWDLYPRKTDRTRTEAMFARATATTDPDTILTGLQAALVIWHRDGLHFAPNPARWLSEQQWKLTPSTNPAADAFMEAI